MDDYYNPLSADVSARVQIEEEEELARALKALMDTILEEEVALEDSFLNIYQVISPYLMLFMLYIAECLVFKLLSFCL